MAENRIDRHSAVKKSLKLEKYIFLKKFKKRLAFCLKVVYDSRVANGSLVKRLRRRPLTAETRVRFPYWLLTESNQNMFLVAFLLGQGPVSRMEFFVFRKMECWKQINHLLCEWLEML